MTIGKVLVTGGAGFIGLAIAKKISAHAERWIALDVLHPQVHQGSEPPADMPSSVELVVGDVTDPTVWDSLLSRYSPDVIIHLAAETGTAQSLDEASRHSRVNVVGTTEMTDALGRNDVTPSHVLLSSSRAVYGEGNWQRASGEIYQPGQRSHDQLQAAQWDFAEASPLASTARSTVPAPTSIYGATKLAQEHVLRAWGGSRGVPVSTLRLQNVYGPGQSLVNSYTGIVSLFSQLAREGRTIPLYEDGQIARDFVYIDDVVDAFVAVIEAGPDPRQPIFDIGTGVASTIEELARVIADFHNAPDPIVSGEFRDGDVRHASCSIADTTSALDWSPQWTLAEGVAALQGWIDQELTAKETTATIGQ